jgi:hypothetical protein
MEENNHSLKSEKLLSKALTHDVAGGNGNDMGVGGKRVKKLFIDKRSYQEAEMDIRSAID